MSSIIAPSRRGVVSLLDMLKFNAHAFVVLSRVIANVDATYEMGRRTNPVFSSTLDTGGMPEAQVVLEIAAHEALKSDCRKLELCLPVDTIEKTLSLLRSRPVSWGEMARLKNEFASRVEDELKRRIFYQLKPEVAAYFDTSQPFGKEVQINSGAHRMTSRKHADASRASDMTLPPII